MAVKKGDFIQVQYTGKLEDGTAFDTTSRKEAEKQGLTTSNVKYGPVVICIGENHIVKGLDRQLEGKKVGEVYTIEISPEEGFGRKDAKLIQMIATNKFKKENINPMPGLQVNIDGMLGIVRNVSGGRTLVDFNHPLSGQKLIYEIRIDRILEDDAEKTKSLIELKTGLSDFDVEVKDKKAVIRTEKDLGLPEKFVKSLSEEVSKIVPAVKNIEFAVKKKDKPKEERTPQEAEKEAKKQ